MDLALRIASARFSPAPACVLSKRGMMPRLRTELEGSITSSSHAWRIDAIPVVENAFRPIAA